MRVRGWLAGGLLAPVLVLMAGLYVVPLGVYLVNGFHRFKDGRILRVWTLDTYVAFLTDPFSFKIVSTSLLLAGIVTALALLVGYPWPMPFTRGCAAAGRGRSWPWSFSAR